MTIRLLLGAASAALCACATLSPPNATPEALQHAIASRPVVLLGEIHDNRVQHALRAQALQSWMQSGARPALAFEQFDRDKQAALDAARAAPAADVPTQAQHMIQAAGAKGWDWSLYQPYVELALRFDVPIVAANLSRAQAMRVAEQGLDAVFDMATQAQLGLSPLEAAVLKAQAREINEGHCGRAPPDALEAMATAQIARDATLAQSILPYATRGVVLITGDGHARRDIGVIHYLPPPLRSQAVSIGLLEDKADAADRAQFYDVALLTPAQERPDPCAHLSVGKDGKMHGQ